MFVSAAIATRPLRRMFELKQHLARLGHQQHAFVLAVGEFLDANRLRIAIAQRDLAAGTLSDRDLIIIILAVAALVLIIVAVR